MKWTKQMARNAEAWVAKYGLLEYGGTLKDFCVSMGISDDTYYRWTDEQGKSYKSEFCEAIKKGRKPTKPRSHSKPKANCSTLSRGQKPPTSGLNSCPMHRANLSSPSGL